MKLFTCTITMPHWPAPLYAVVLAEDAQGAELDLRMRLALDRQGVPNDHPLQMVERPLRPDVHILDGKPT